MKWIKCFGLLYAFTLSACGQVQQKTSSVSTADSIRLKSYEDKSKLYQNTSPDSAIYFANKGLKFSRSIHYHLGEGLMLNRFARINEKYGNFKLAVKYQKAALSIFNSLHDAAAALDASASLGVLEAGQGNFAEGTRLIKYALKQYEKNRDANGIIQAYTKLAEINELHGNAAQALQYYKKAEDLNNNKPVTDEYFDLIARIGKLHTKLGNHKQAADYFEKGINKSTADKHVKAHIVFLNNAGKAYDSLGNKDKALTYHKQGLQQAQANGLHEEEARSLIGIASALKDRDANESIVHLKNALTIARSIGHKQLSAEIYSSLSDLYRQQSRYQEALAALEAHHRLLDSLVTANEGHKIAVLQSSYDLAESKLHIEALELVNEKKTEQLDEGIIGVISVLVLLLVLAFYFYKTRRLNKKLEASNLVKDKLFSIIGHDLRNPIGGITQLLAMMEEGNLTPDEHRLMISEMKKQGDITLEILNALLNWGESQLKGIHIKPAEFNARPGIEKNIAALRQQAEDKSVIILNNVPAGLNSYGDINHFEFVVRNLLSNAIKFSFDSGTVEVNADDSTDAAHTIFSVKDTGKGINKAQQELFLKSNLDISYGTKGEKGTGIGLMLSKEFIRANHGRIWLESGEGKGTTFYFTWLKTGKKNS